LPQRKDNLVQVSFFSSAFFSKSIPSLCEWQALYLHHTALSRAQIWAMLKRQKRKTRLDVDKLNQGREGVGVNASSKSGRLSMRMRRLGV